MWQEILNRHQNTSEREDKEDEPCQHINTVDEDSFDVCLDCGQIIGRKFVATRYAPTGTARRKMPICSIYSCIPSELVDGAVKNLAVNIYKTVTIDHQYRATFRKAIIAACIHRSSIILRKPMTLAECAKVAGISSSFELDKGIMFVANNLPHDEYAIPICIIDTFIDPIVKEFDLDTARVNKVVAKLSACRFQVCACIWFYIVSFDKRTSIKDFTTRYNSIDSIGLKHTTVPTIKRKYLEIKTHVVRCVMKNIFARFLFENVGNNVTDDSGCVIVTETGDHNLTRVVGSDGFVYPIEDVDDIMEWNLLLDLTWKHKKFPFRLCATKTDVTFPNYEHILTNEMKRYFEF